MRRKAVERTTRSAGATMRVEFDERELDHVVSLGTSNVVMAVEFVHGQLTEDQWAYLSDRLEDSLTELLKDLSLPSAPAPDGELLPSGRPRRFIRQ